MIDFLFTIDYELYGNGTGSLNDLVYQPTERLREIFEKWNQKFVAYVEVAEFEKIEQSGTDSAIGLVTRQIRQMYRDGHEIALHLHPQWCNARFENNTWLLDESEYNLCTLPRARIAEIVEQSLQYLRHTLNEPRFTPLSFRAGNWLFQPTGNAADVLSAQGIRVDSSVFKGGVQHRYGLDYRRAQRNGSFWRFSTDAQMVDPAGSWIEVPIYSEMVWPWKMATSKRLGFSNSPIAADRSFTRRLSRMRDVARFRYPLKLDFCRMTLQELISMLERVIREDRQDPEAYRPVVSIGHSKDLNDFQTVDDLLAFLQVNGIAVATFEEIYPKLSGEKHAVQRDAR
jgi:hypothetical protein